MVYNAKINFNYSLIFGKKISLCKWQKALFCKSCVLWLTCSGWFGVHNMRYCHQYRGNFKHLKSHILNLNEPFPKLVIYFKAPFFTKIHWLWRHRTVCFMWTFSWIFLPNWKIFYTFFDNDFSSRLRLCSFWTGNEVLYYKS